MAISRNLTLGAVGAGRAADVGDGGGGKAAPTGRAALAGIATPITAAAPIFTAPIVVGPPPPATTVAPPPAATAPATSILGSIATAPAVSALPGLTLPLRPPIIDFPPPIFPFPRPLIDKSTTQIAQGAVNQLRTAAADVIREGVNNVRNKNIAAADLMNFLERRTRVGEVLNELAHDWSDQTKGDFAEAFQMPNTADKLPVMDSIVSLAILNDPDLRNELQAENTTDASEQDLLENRRIVWQWPQPGTAFTPPYLIVVAVERQDTAQAQNVIQSIIGDLVDFQGFKLPSAAAQRLR